MTDLEDARIRAADAQQLLQNPLFKAAFEAVDDYIDQQTLGCEADNKDRAQRIVLSKQILAAVKREIQRHIENGKVADIRIAELEKRKAFRLFQR